MLHLKKNARHGESHRLHPEAGVEVAGDWRQERALRVDAARRPR